MSLTREQLLRHVHPMLQTTARSGPSSPTKSTYRVRWRELLEWDDFVSEAQTYWNGLGDEQKEMATTAPINYWEVVYGDLGFPRPVSREPDLIFPFRALYAAPHNRAISGANDQHAYITTELPDDIVGQPDACLQYDNRLVGIIELKTFWNLTESAILEVIQGTAPLAGDHHGRLAVEQAFGYMFHNSVVYGVISTVNAFAFLRREKGGKLGLTPLIPATQTDHTVLCMLYYFSNLCAASPQLVETHPDGRPITPIRAPSDSSTAPLIPLPSLPRTTSSSYLSHIQLNSRRRSPRFQHIDSSPAIDQKISDQLYLDIDVTVSGTWLGCKGYKGVLHTGEIVFAKLWDGWKHSSEEADREVAIYNSLHRLWGTIIPKFIAHGGWGFSHIVVIEFIKGSMLSDVIVTPQIETNVIEAFKKLHQHRVYHGDIRPANIIVRDDESVVLIDFERSVLNASRRMLSEERNQVRHMLQVAKKQIGRRNQCVQ